MPTYKVLGSKLPTLWSRINEVLVPRQATVSSGDGYYTVTLQNAVTPTPNALVSFNIPASSGGSGGSTVTISRSLSTGTQIATVTVDGATTTLFAPSPPTNYVSSINTKTGAVTLTAGDNIAVNAASNTITLSVTGLGSAAYTASTAYLPSSTTYVGSLNSKTGTVTITGTGNITVNSNSNTITISTTGEANQNAFSNIKIGTSTIAADSTTDTLTISAGTNISLTADTTNDILTISAAGGSSGEANQNAFSYINANGTTLTADSTTDTLTVSAGNNINITADANNDKFTISATVPTQVSQLQNDSGYTSNIGTVTGVKINNSTKAPSSGVVDLGTVLTTYTYTLPTASTTTLGGIKIGNGLSINSTGVVSAAVASVNSKTGAVTLTAADVGALPSSTVVPTQTSQLQNNSGFLTSAVTSLNSKTGVVTIAAGDNITVSSSSNTITISASGVDTKNTVGATTTSSKIYLVGTTTQTTCPQSYTNNSLYYNGGLYSAAYSNPADSSISQSYGHIKLEVNDATGYGNSPGGVLTVSQVGISINPVVTPTAAGDAANKQYVDNSGVPIGTILDFAGGTAPSGYLLCDGSAVSRTTYADLFEILNDENDNLPWGDGDGSTTFNLPNLCGRTTIGVGTGTASDATAHTLGSANGQETHSLTPSETATKSHSHTYAKSKTSTDSHALSISEIPSHDHKLIERNSSGTSTMWAFMTESGKYSPSNTRCQTTGGGGGHTHGIGTTSTATTDNPSNANGTAHNNMQPYATVNKIIKAL